MTDRPRLIEAYMRGWPRVEIDAMIRSRIRAGFHQILAQGLDRPDRPTLIPTFERRLTEELDALRGDAIAQRLEYFDPIVEGKRSIGERYARLRARFRGPTPGAPD